MFASQKQFDAVFCVWARHAPLRQLLLLVWPHWFTAATLAALRQVRAAPVPLFARLTELQLSVHARAVSGLVDLLTLSPLTEMTLFVDSGDDGYDDSDHNDDNGADKSIKYAVLPAVARLTMLRTLAVYLFYAEHEVSTDDLLALRSLTQLRYLSLSCGPAPAVAPVHMRQLLGALPLLQTLCCRLMLRHDTDGLLLAIGEACQQLRRLELWGEHDMADLAARYDNELLFPMLLTLHVGRLKHRRRKVTAYVPNP
jgi:hypothetical protein